MCIDSSTLHTEVANLIMWHFYIICNSSSIHPPDDMRFVYRLYRMNTARSYVYMDLDTNNKRKNLRNNVWILWIDVFYDLHV